MDDEEKLALLREQYPNLTDEELEDMLDEQYIDFMVEAFELNGYFINYIYKHTGCRGAGFIWYFSLARARYLQT